MYKNFLHWNLSKVLIFTWSIILGVILMIPVFIIALIVGVIDPIGWIELTSSVISGQDPSFELIASLAEYPYWLGVMVFLAGTGVVSFLLGSSYSLLLMARLSLKYVDRKKLDLRKNLYFSKQHIKAFLVITSLNSIFLLAPIIITVGIIAIVSLVGPEGSVFQWSSVVLILACIGTLIFLLYKILFGYIVLAHQKKNQEVASGKSYITSSIALSSLRNIWKFLFIFILYVLLMSPFNSYESYLEKQMQYMGSALAYKTGQISDVSDSEMKYYKFVSAEYGTLTNEELQQQIIGVSRARMLIAVVLYFVFGGLGVMLLSSFYMRVLLKNTKIKTI